MNKILYRIHYVSTPAVKDQHEQYLILESLRNKVWNPVFTTGVITFVTSMLFRGFFSSSIAVFPLGISTLVLFSGIWILSSNAQIVFDKDSSLCYAIYKHLGYLQKIYTYPLMSFDEIFLEEKTSQKFSLQLLKDDGKFVTIAVSKNKEQLQSTGNEIAQFLKIPFQFRAK